MSDWLESSQEARKRMQDALDALLGLCESLRHVGQPLLAKSIEHHVYIVSDAEETLGVAIGEAVDEMVVSSRQATVNMVVPVLNVLRAAARIETVTAMSAQNTDPEEVVGA